ncbi:MAG: hypothetical protein HYZ71_08805 [Deltaproteobacteria bacterium]|nr:hypothetical protein [Deltaproteobacteria bacterium]
MKALNGVRFLVIALVLILTYTGCKKDSVKEETAVVNTYTGKPYRTFVTIQRYNLEQLGASTDSISNVRLAITFPDGQSFTLPESGQYWPIGNAQTQEINRTFEIPWRWLRSDGFRMTVQMERRGADFLPCVFDITQLSLFNRSYVCHTDVQWQITQDHATDATADKEGVQVRVFTDLNSNANEIPKELARRN